MWNYEDCGNDFDRNMEYKYVYKNVSEQIMLCFFIYLFFTFHRSKLGYNNR